MFLVGQTYQSEVSGCNYCQLAQIVFWWNFFWLTRADQTYNWVDNSSDWCILLLHLQFQRDRKKSEGGERKSGLEYRKKSQTSQTQTSWFTQTSHDTMYIYSPECNIAQLREKPVDHLVLRLWCTSAANQDFSTSKINNLQLVAGMASCSVNSTVNINSNSNLRPALQSLPPVRTDQLCKACTPINSPPIQ